MDSDLRAEVGHNLVDRERESQIDLVVEAIRSNLERGQRRSVPVAGSRAVAHLALSTSFVIGQSRQLRYLWMYEHIGWPLRI